ncbi:hypothetical protein [Halosimplex amylolyticum]|uniref:hypothetical protein n=1 Tax=Halosimplex amylolyticum TaxID=3396616 RepID=UPI003F556127
MLRWLLLWWLLLRWLLLRWLLLRWRRLLLLVPRADLRSPVTEVRRDRQPDGGERDVLFVGLPDLFRILLTEPFHVGPLFGGEESPRVWIPLELDGIETRRRPVPSRFGWSVLSLLW